MQKHTVTYINTKGIGRGVSHPVWSYWAIYKSNKQSLVTFIKSDQGARPDPIWWFSSLPRPGVELTTSGSPLWRYWFNSNALDHPAIRLDGSDFKGHETLRRYPPPLRALFSGVLSIWIGAYLSVLFAVSCSQHKIRLSSQSDMGTNPEVMKLKPKVWYYRGSKLKQSQSFFCIRITKLRQSRSI